MNSAKHEEMLAKVPEVTLGFWIIKIAATTLGETGGDTVSMSLNLGYLASTAIFAAIFVIAVIAQIRASHFHPFVYWTTIVATTTVGTTLADFVDRSLGIGYAGGHPTAHPAAGHPVCVVSHPRHAGGRIGQFAAGGILLLAGDPVFPDPGHGPRRLDGRRHGTGL